MVQQIIAIKPTFMLQQINPWVS